jgi:hypothetical protein
MSSPLLGLGEASKPKSPDRIGDFTQGAKLRMKRISRDSSTPLGMTKERTEMLARLSDAQTYSR